jgi:hypothetical protein
LAAVLTDVADSVFDSYQVRLEPDSYQKMHSTFVTVTKRIDQRIQVVPTAMMNQTELDQYHSVRIQVNHIDQLLTVAYLWHTKQITWKPELDAIPGTILRHERAVDLAFDHTVTVSDLWNIQRIAALYHQFTQAQLTPERQAVILSNIQQQPWITLDNYEEYFPQGVVGLNTLYERLHNE